MQVRLIVLFPIDIISLRSIFSSSYAPFSIHTSCSSCACHPNSCASMSDDSTWPIINDAQQRLRIPRYASFHKFLPALAGLLHLSSLTMLRPGWSNIRASFSHYPFPQAYTSNRPVQPWFTPSPFARPTRRRNEPGMPKSVSIGVLLHL